jgi:hypothetical protein
VAVIAAPIAGVPLADGEEEPGRHLHVPSLHIYVGSSVPV